jgi:hypothetical protein
MQSKIPALAALVLHASEKKNGLSMLQRHVPKLLASAQPCRPSLFKLIHGIVRETDSQRQWRAQHMKSYGQIIEISCKNEIRQRSVRGA